MNEAETEEKGAGSTEDPLRRGSEQPAAWTLCSNLSIRLGGRELVRDAELQVAAGEIVALMGPSGVGKSVLAGVIFGLESGGGAVDYEGTIGVAAAHGALVFQQGGALPHLSVGENLALVGGDDKAQAQLARELDLDPGRSAHVLSGGEKRRLGAARAFLAGRKILWFDEPAAGLDITRVDRLVEILRGEAEERQAAIVVTTHRAEFATALADRVVFFGADGVLRDLTIPSSAEKPGDESGVRSDVERQSAEARPGARELEDVLRVEIARRGAPPHNETPPRFRLPTVLNWPAEWVLSVMGLVGLGGRTARSAWRSLALTCRISVLQGALFYPFVGAIFGAIFLLIFYLSLSFIDTGRVLVEFGPMIVLRLSPAFAGILVAARGGSAVSSWVGQMSATRQFDALRVLGVSEFRAVTGPAWLGLTFAGVVGILSFAAALTGVFGWYLETTGEGELTELLAGFGGAAGRVAMARVLLFSMLVASITIASARARKVRADEVASGITRGIVHSTLWIMISELVILALELPR